MNELWLAGTYSIAGFVMGVVVGKYWCNLNGRSFPVFWRSNHEDEAEHYDPKARIPDVIPAVRFDRKSGEPIIAREEVHHRSPLPKWLATIIVILACLSLAYTVASKAREADAARAANDRLAAQVERNHDLVLALAHQQAIVNENEQRLESLVLAISTAKTPGEVKEAIHHFLHSSTKAHHKEMQYRREHGGQAQNSSSPSGDTQGSRSPQPSHSSSPEPSRSPQPTSSPTSSPTPRPTPSPTKSPLVCVITPAGKICTPVAVMWVRVAQLVYWQTW